MTVTPIRTPCPTRAALAIMWQPIPDRAPYEAGWDGRIRNSRTGHVLKPQQAKSGRYAKVHLGHSAQAQVHQLVAEAWLPRPKVGMPLVVDHVDNTGSRNCVTNLRWLTYSMNTRQWYAMNARYQQAGEEHGWDLGPAADEEAEEQWVAEYERLQAAGL